MYLSGLAGRERQGRCDAVTGPTCTPWADTDNYGPMQGAHEMQMEKQTRVHFHLLFLQPPTKCKWKKTNAFAFPCAFLCSRIPKANANAKRDSK
jgi:hypothetical protein